VVRGGFSSGVQTVPRHAGLDPASRTPDVVENPGSRRSPGRRYNPGSRRSPGRR